MDRYKKKKWLPAAVAIAFLSFFADKTIAAPWIDPGEQQLRHHVQVLADAGVITTPITTWPLPWAAIAGDLERATPAAWPASVGWSLAYVKFYLDRAQSRLNLQARVATQGDPVVFRHFGADQREENEASGEIDWLGKHLAARLRLTWAPEASDDKEYRLDGSYVAGVLGNWGVSVGAIDRWWGPAWQSSLILSHNARPVTAVSLQRQASTAFETPWLSWIGPWSFTAFAGQLESNRAIPDAKLLGARLALKPFQGLEIGLSRAVQWGGDGRPQDWDSFWNAMIGNDNADTETTFGDNEPGNQLGAADVRFGFPLANTYSAVYLQYAGEDESGGFPSRGFVMAGVESAFEYGNIFHRIAAEYSDTLVGAHNGDERPNVAYEHHLYHSGYRYFGRTLGSTFDNDTRAVSLLVDHYLSGESQLSWRIGKLDLNRDRLNRNNGWGGSPFMADDSLIWAEISWSFVISSVKVSTSVYNVDQPFHWNNQKIDGTGFGLALEYRPD